MKSLREIFHDPALLDLVILADAVQGLMHELNNGLNRVALQVSVIQMHLKDRLREETTQMRRETAQAAALLRPLQRVRQQQMKQETAIDLNVAVAEVLEAVPTLTDRYRFVPAASLPSLHTEPGKIQRSIAYFLRLATSAGGPTPLRTETRNDGPKLVVDLPARQESRSVLEELFDSQSDMATAESLLERLAFQSLLHQSSGTLGQEEKPGHGVFVAWPAR